MGLHVSVESRPAGKHFDLSDQPLFLKGGQRSVDRIERHRGNPLADSRKDCLCMRVFFRAGKLAKDLRSLVRHSDAHLPESLGKRFHSLNDNLGR